jgi:flagellar FliL protein
MAKEEEPEGTEAKGGGKKKLILMAVPILLLLAGAGWFFLLKPDSAGAPKALPEPKPGAVLKLDSTTVNLVNGHFLKFGMAIQPTASAKVVDGSEAMDLAITEFSGKTMDDLLSEKGRTDAKDELTARIKLAYLPEGSMTEKAIEAANEKVSGGKTKHDADLTAEQAIKRAAALTVQPDVYELYFTEFVIQ